jgi:replicative DNA helicase
MPIQKLIDLTNSSFEELLKIQKGEKLLVKTNFDFIDDHLNGLLPGDTVILSGLSGHGKSETLFRIAENIMSTKVNPNAMDFVWLNFNLEVKMFNVLLRGLNRKLKKKKQEILYNTFTDEERVLVTEYYMTLSDERQFVCQDNITAKDFFSIADKFLEDNRGKEAVHISVDHAALIGDKNKTEGIEELIGYVNQLKLKYDNAYFWIISQLNRKILERAQEKNNHSAPNAGDLYQSSTMDFISSYNIVVFDAYKLGITQFMKASQNRYDYLSNHFGDIDNKGKVSFNTAGKLFYKVIKTRESDVMWKDLYVIDKDIDAEDLNRLKDTPGSISSRNTTRTPSFGTDEDPIEAPIKFGNPADAFGPFPKPNFDDGSAPF